MARRFALLFAVLPGCVGDVPPLVGPAELPVAELPAVARLHQGNVLCSGALVAPRLVLTAKHCIRGGGGIQVFLGTHPPIRVSRVARASAADLALLTLERPAPAEVVPLPLAVPASDRRRYKGQPARLVGFGRIPAGERAPVKHQAMARVVDDSGGVLFLKAAPRDVCHGDSGGPILVSDGQGEKIAAVLASKLDLERGQRCSAVAEGARVDAHWRDFLEPAIRRAQGGFAELGTSCAGAADCRAGLSCEGDPARDGARVCTRACGAGGCPQGLECREGRCLLAVASGSPPPAPCARDEECPSGACVSGRCAVRCLPEVPGTCAEGTRCAPDPGAPGRDVCIAGAARETAGGEGEGWPATKAIYAGLLVLFLVLLLGRHLRPGGWLRR